MELKGKTILITGGSAGIGLEAAKQFITEGAKVIITGRDQKKLDLAKKMHPSITTIKSDASSQEAAIALYNQINEMGGIDILYNNAGIMNGQDNLGFSNSKHFEKAAIEINTNYLGVILLNDLFLNMLKQKRSSYYQYIIDIELHAVQSCTDLFSIKSCSTFLYRSITRSFTDNWKQHKNI